MVLYKTVTNITKCLFLLNLFIYYYKKGYSNTFAQNF